MKISELTHPFHNTPMILYGSDCSKAVRKQIAVRKIAGNLYMGKIKKDRYGMETFGLYACYPDCPVGVHLCTIDRPEEHDTNELYQKALEAYPEVCSLEQFLDELKMRESKGSFIGNREIEFLKYAAPEHMEHYRLYREKYLQQSQERQRQVHKQNEEKNAEFCRTKNQEAEEIIQNTMEIIFHSGVLHNSEVSYYQGRYDYTTYKLVNYLFKRYEVKLPIKVQGWVNQSLVNITFKDGNAVSFTFLKGRESKTFPSYFEKLLEAIHIKRNELESNNLIDEGSPNIAELSKC